jgi:hypothetical protein
MILKKRFYPFVMTMMLLLPLLFIGFQGCEDDHSQPEEGGITPECIVVGRFIEFRGPSPSGFYEMDIEILESHDLGEAENPTKDMIGKTITVFTQDYSEAILPNEIIAAYVGNYGESGTDYLVARGLHPANLSENSNSSDK